MPDTRDFRLVALARYCREHTNVLAHVATSHIVIFSRLLHQRGTAQHSTAQHSTAQHSTAQHSTAQHSTAQHRTGKQSEDDMVKEHSDKFKGWMSGYKD